MLLLVSSLLGAQSRVVLSVAHDGTVHDAAAHPSQPYAFTVGDDGRLLVWDLEREALLYRYQVSHRPITRVIHHPDRNEVALLVNEGVSRSSIRVVNWETGEQLYRRDLGSVPVYLAYSPAGTYLLLTMPTFRSLFLLSAGTGSARSYLDDGFGIVNFVQMGSSERTIMTYVPARGEFIYWNLQDGAEQGRITGPPRLSHLTLVDPRNRRAIAAAHGDELVIVDNVDGGVRASYPLSPIVDIRYDARNERILVLTEQVGRRSVLAFTYENGRLRRAFFRPQNMSESAQFVAPMGGARNALLAGDDTGQVELFAATSGRRTVIGPPAFSAVTDVAFTEGRLHLSLGDRILTLVSDGFDSSARFIGISSVRQTMTSLPLTGAQMERDGERILIWGTSEEPGTIFELVPPSTQPGRFYLDEDQNPIRTVRSTDGGPLVIYRDGRVIQLASNLQVERFRYMAVGAQAAVWDPQLGIVAAKTRSGAIDPAIIRVDPLTQETVPVVTNAFLATDVALGSRSTVYALGLFGSPEFPESRLLRISGDELDQIRQLDEFAGEDATARVLWDRRTNAVLTTLGYEGVKRISGRTLEIFQSTGQIPREMAVQGLLVASANRDGSVTLCNRESGEHQFDIYVRGSDWIALNRRGVFLSSSPALEQYLDFIPERRTRLTLEDFRMELPYRE